MNGGSRRVSFKAVALNSQAGFKDVALNGGLVGVCFQGSSRLGFKAVALNLQGGFKDVALNGWLVGLCFQGFSLESGEAEGLVSRL